MGRTQVIDPLHGATIADVRKMKPGSLFWIPSAEEEGRMLLGLRLKDRHGDEDDPPCPAFIEFQADQPVTFEYESNRAEFCYVIGTAAVRVPVGPEHVEPNEGRTAGALCQGVDSLYLFVKMGNDTMLVNMRTFDITERVTPLFRYGSWSLGIETAQGEFFALHHSPTAVAR